MVRCAFCGTEFDPQEAKLSCSSCPLVKMCTHHRCPNCGYENVANASIFSLLKKRKEGIHVKQK